MQDPTDVVFLTGIVAAIEVYCLLREENGRGFIAISLFGETFVLKKVYIVFILKSN